MKLIDRTLPELMSLKKRPSRLDLIDFCFMLQYAGVDLIEIDLAALQRIGRMPKGIRYSYRIGAGEDGQRLQEWLPAMCVFDQSLFARPGLIRDLAASGCTMVLEVPLATVEDVRALSDIHRIRRHLPVGGLRLTGMDGLFDPELVDAALAVGREADLPMDFCPGNRCSLATGTAVEALKGGASFVTASFCGIGGFAPIEEVMAACLVLMPGLRRGAGRTDRSEEQAHSLRLNGLQQMRILFERLSGMPVSDHKPVIGERIFHCESGIHVDGIRKNPATYEPFPPEWVGLNRQLVIGKHTGRQALSEKLSMMRLAVDDALLESLLEAIRARSIQLGRGLQDEDIRKIVAHVCVPDPSGRFPQRDRRPETTDGEERSLQDGEDRRYDPA